MLFHVKRNPDTAWKANWKWLDILAIGGAGEFYVRCEIGFKIYPSGDITISPNLAHAKGHGADYYMAEKDEA